jgi:tetraacyldisaccharide 4'-kinase
MRLRTPDFWYRRGASPLSSALLPASLLYRLGHKIHQRGATPYKASVPVICVGNIVAGGSGKTPAALALAALLKQKGIAHTPYFLTRGYGGTMPGPALVEPHHTAAQAGDEPMLLSRTAPTIVSADRAGGAKLATRKGADAVIMDDGLQNPGLAKTIKFVVVDGATGFGNKRLLPAGPLRTTLKAGIAMADAFIVIGGAAPPEVAASGKPVFSAALETDWRPDPGAGYIAFSGLGRPEKFFHTLRDRGADLKDVFSFPDHHPYNDADMKSLGDEAVRHSARLITTEKDAVRLPPGQAVDVMPVTLRFADEGAVAAFLKSRWAVIS